MPDLGQLIVEKARGRLLANTEEYKELEDIGVVSTGCLARVIALNQVQTLRKEFSCSALDTILDRSREKDRRTDECTFADFTLAAPILVYWEAASNRPVMIDGDRRLKQLLRQGVPTVKVVILERKTVEAFRIADPVVPNYRTLQRLQNWPIRTAQADTFRNATVIKVDVDDDLRQQGGQRLSDDAARIRDTFYFFAADYLDMEWFVYKNIPAEAVFSVRYNGNNLKRDVVNQLAYDELRRACPFLPQLNTIVNKVGRATRNLTGRVGHVATKRHSLAEWDRMLRNDKGAFDDERKNVRLIPLALWKAQWRRSTWSLAQRQLVDAEFSKTHLRRHDIVNYHDDQDRYTETELDFHEQRLITEIAGINIQRIYNTSAHLDPLFEAYAFAYHYCNSNEVGIDPGMIETVLHRRALTVLGQRDAFTDVWDELFKYWSKSKIEDATIFKILDAADGAYAHYAPATVQTADLKL